MGAHPGVVAGDVVVDVDVDLLAVFLGDVEHPGGVLGKVLCDAQVAAYDVGAQLHGPAHQVKCAGGLADALLREGHHLQGDEVAQLIL